ncbi:ComEC/Rec2 family competence protein [Rhodocytophaga aerolata]|uniref:ComEC/Rec2 family competence protein n=1 Tax=Rhodocytophaga aerolata TaxID=455078 RepID=A0ABT8RK15_9BACT|nr:ComEC/Rec2 family competence protein [Rhodocytophaga aerolata]MDO1451167.1 ComEC/Rec2 family competence protein [Rhodocytophaga aerolata]
MIKWAPYVFVRLTAYLIAGILAAVSFPVSVTAIGYLVPVFYFLAAGYVAFYLLIRIVWKGKRFSTLTGLLGLIIIFLAGYVITHQRNQSTQPGHLLQQPAFIQYYSGVVVSEVTTGAKSHKAHLEVTHIYQQEKWRNASGKVLLYLDTKTPKPQYGDKLLIKAHPQRVPAPANPDEFDYRHYLQLQQIYHQHFVKAAQVAIYENQPPSRVMAVSIRIRQKADSIFKVHIPSQREYAIASGLVLGIRNGLDNEIKEAYSSAGAMHVLAVSGAHVIIVFGIITFFLQRIKKIRYGQALFALTALSLLWFYAFITGLSASVLRAVVMFSFVVIAQAANKQNSIYNTLALSAFILLCYDPLLLMDVGFQLSYAAMLSIVYISPKIYHLLEFDTYILDKAWLITCASLAAQIGTVPLSLLYFHQFPVYFLLANLVIIPLSAVILYLGIATLFFSFVPYVSTGLAFLLELAVKLLNLTAFATEALPGALIKNISINASESLLLYLVIIAFLLFVYYKKLIYWSVTVGLVCLLAILNVVEITKQHQQQQIAMYSIANHTALSVLEGGQNYFMADSALLRNTHTIDFHLTGHWRQAGIITHHFTNFYKPEPLPVAFQQFQNYSILVWQGKTFLFVQKPISSWQAIASLQPDYLVVQHNAVKDLTGKEAFIKHLIIDGTTKPYIASKLAQQALQAKIPCYSIREEGAFILTKN